MSRPAIGVWWPRSQNKGSSGGGLDRFLVWSGLKFSRNSDEKISVGMQCLDMMPDPVKRACTEIVGISRISGFIQESHGRLVRGGVLGEERIHKVLLERISSIYIAKVQMQVIQLMVISFQNQLTLFWIELYKGEMGLHISLRFYSLYG